MNAVELTCELVRIDTINPRSPERPAAELCARLLEKAGWQVRLHEFAPGRASVVARREGPGERKPICFAGHLDTVPLGARAWSRDPFAGEIDSGKLHGRGSSDMKSGVAAMVAAALLMKRFPKAGMTLLLLAGEETGCEGAAHLARLPGALGSAGALVVGEPTGNQPVLGHKGALWLRARTRGVTAHGSMPERGVNAVVKAARAVLQLAEVRFAIAPDPLLGAPTLNIGTIAGGLNVNSVPDEAAIGIDIRTIPAQRHAQVRKELQAALGPEVELSALVDLEGVRTPEDDPFVQTVLGIVEAPPGVATYFTDASVLTPAFGGVATVVLGPGEMALCHQTDEYCRVDRIEESVEVYGRIARAWCGS
ncbi:MAG: M20 family metallopeptidase [Deltaproteobacteria bacterium]|nr:MAG: M20 family metallopeptidase [Deltaproteobacteria bacterium]